MSMTFGIRGVRTEYEPEEMGRTFANFHNMGARLVCDALNLDPYGGEIRARELKKRVHAALKSAHDAQLVRRLCDLGKLANAAGELGKIWYG